MSKGAAALGRLIFDGSLLPSVQGSTGSPLAFPIQGGAHGLPAGARAVACLVADRAGGVLVAARPIAQWPGKKSPSCVTTRRRKLWFFNGLRRGLHSLAAHLFGLGVLGFDVAVLATFGLPPSVVPAVQLALAIGVLTITLVVTTRSVFARAPVAQTDPQARAAPAARSRLAAEISRTLASAHGRFCLPRESSGRMVAHSPRALSKRELQKRSRYSSARDEPDKERNNVRYAHQNQTPGPMTTPVAHSK
jgi:hypothetical protein